MFAFLIPMPLVHASGITLVSQGTNGYAQGTGTTGNGAFTVTLQQTPVNGNLLILVFSSDSQSYGATISGISETGVTWYQAVAIGELANGAVLNVAIWYGVVGSGAGTTITVTITSSSGSDFGEVADVCEFAGLSSVFPVDQTAYNLGASSSSGDTGTTSSTTEADELFVGTVGVGTVTSYNATQSNPTNGFTLLDGANETLSGELFSLSFLYKVVSSEGTANSGTTLGSSDVIWAGCIATFVSANPYPLVTLDTPINCTAYAHNPVTFSFTPECAASAQLWMNMSGTWQSIATDSSVTNGQQNSISYSMPQNTNNYAWNIEVINSAGNAFAPTNFIITDSPLPSGIGLVADGSNLLNSAGQVVQLRDVGVEGFAPDLSFWTSTENDSWGGQWQAANSAAVTQTLQQLSTVWHVNMIRFFIYPEWFWTGTGAISLVPSTESGEGYSSTPVNATAWMQTFISECETYGIYVDMCPYSLVAGADSFAGDPYANSGDPGLPMSSNWATEEQAFLTATGYGSNELGFWQAFWTQMANDYGSYPNLIFEAWNEPALSGYQNTVPAGYLSYLQTMYSTIRGTGSTDLIFMMWNVGWCPNLGGTMAWASQITYALGNPTNLVYNNNLYYYSPYDLTPYWNQNGIDNDAGGVPMTISQLETQLQDMVNSMGVNAPLVVNEEGDCSANTANITSDYIWWNNLLQAQDALGIGAGAYYWLSSSGLGGAFIGEELLTSGYTPNTMGQEFIDAYTGPALSYFTISVPSSATAGTSFGSVVVTAYQSNGTVFTSYTGSVYFTSSDSEAVLPYASSSMYTFTAGSSGNDNSIHAFSGFTLETAGSQTITVIDPSAEVSQTSGSITVSASTLSSLTVSLSSSSITAASTTTVTDVGYDAYGNSLGSETSATLWSITSGAGGSWASNIYISYTAGSWTVTATIGSVQGTASLTVNPVYSSISIVAGWNEISFSVIPSDTTFSSILSGVGTYEVYTWTGSTYVMPTNVIAGQAYWVFVPSNQTLTVSGTPVTSVTVSLSAGWTMIGSVNSQTIPASIFTGYFQLYIWTGTSYQVATSISDSCGYWVFVENAQNVTL